MSYGTRNTLWLKLSRMQPFVSHRQQFATAYSHSVFSVTRFDSLFRDTQMFILKKQISVLRHGLRFGADKNGTVRKCQNAPRLRNEWKGATRRWQPDSSRCINYFAFCLTAMYWFAKWIGNSEPIRNLNTEDYENVKAMICEAWRLKMLTAAFQSIMCWSSIAHSQDLVPGMISEARFGRTLRNGQLCWEVTELHSFMRR